MAGYGGAIKNASIGLASSEGKSLIHSGGSGSGNLFGDGQDAFTEAMAEASKSVADTLTPENIVYINVLNNISIDCDCNGNPTEPDIHDIGILASKDPVALDQASIDLALDAEGSETLRERIEEKNGLHTLELAEEIGHGIRAYELIKIDH